MSHFPFLWPAKSREERPALRDRAGVCDNFTLRLEAPGGRTIRWRPRDA
jgi:hypothetical protein